MTPGHPSESDVLAYLTGEFDGVDRPRDAAELDDLRALLGDPAMWEEPGPGLADRIVSAIAVEASTASPPEPRAGPDGAERPAAPPAPPTVLHPRRRFVWPAAAIGVAASVVLGTVVGVRIATPEGPAADPGAGLPAQAQALQPPVPGAPSVTLSRREKETIPDDQLKELNFDGPGAGLGRFPGLVYWLTTGPDGSSRLSREIATFYDNAGRANGALSAMLNRRPSDPDERSPWPAGSSGQVVLDVPGDGDQEYPEGTAVVSLDSTALRAPAAVSADTARMAVEQLVWTLTANAPTIRQVVITAQDAKARPELRKSGLWGTGVSVSKPIRPGDPLQVLAPVQIDGPAEAAELNPEVFAVSGAAMSSTGKIRWQVLSRGQVVSDGTAKTDGCCGLKPFVFRISLPPGTYTVTVLPDEAKTGAVSRTFRVRGLPT